MLSEHPTPAELDDLASRVIARGHRLRTRRRLAQTGAAAIAVIALVAGFVSLRGTSNEQIHTISPPTTSTPTSATTTTTIAAIPGSDSSPGDSVGTPTQTPPPSTAADTPSAPSTPTPATTAWAVPAGSYTSSVNGYGKHPGGGDPTSTTAAMDTDTLQVDTPNGAQQHSLRYLSDSSGATFEFDQTVEHRDDGFHLVNFTRTYGPGTTYVSTCQLDAAPLILPTDPQPGYHLHVSIPNCRYYYAGNFRTADLTVDILHNGTITIAGTAVPAVEVRVEITFNGGATSTQNEDDVNDQWVRPTDGLVLQESRNDTITNGGIGATSPTWTYNGTLTSLEPT